MKAYSAYTKEDFINDKLATSSSEMRDNADLFLDGVLKISEESLKYLNERNIYNIKKIRVTPKLTISLAKEILTDINPELTKLFDEYYEEGKILVFPQRKKASLREKYLKEGKYFEASCLTQEGYNVCCGSQLDDVLVVCPLNGDISDVIYMVHEIIHLYSRVTSFSKGNFVSNHKSSFLTEMPSIYFEKYAVDYLVNKGFDKESVYDIYYGRLINDSLTSVFYLEELDVVNTYKKAGFVSLKNVMKDDRLSKVTENLLEITSMYKGVNSRYIDLLKNTGDVLNGEDSRAWLTRWMASTDVVNSLSAFKYILGHFYTNSLDQERSTMDKVLGISHDVSLPTCDVSDSELLTRVNGLVVSKEKQKILSKVSS